MPITKAQENRLKALGERVKYLRNSKGLSMQELAYSIGKERQSIGRLESGKINPSFLYLIEVCEGLEIPITELLDYMDNSK